MKKVAEAHVQDCYQLAKRIQQKNVNGSIVPKFK
jgi:hypothetical protein